MNASSVGAAALGAMLALWPAARDGLVPRAPAAERVDRPAAERLIERHGCGGCHTVPGVPGAVGTRAPPLAHYDQRAHVAGTLAPGSLTAFLLDPPHALPGSTMPAPGLTPADAAAIARHLRTPP